MSIHLRTHGIIIQTHERGEADRVFHCFTKDFGKVTLFAKGSRKIGSKLRGGLEMLCLSDIEFVEGKRNTVVDAALLERYAALRKDLRRMRLALRVAKTLHMFLKGQAQDEQIWKLFTKTLETLNNPGFSPKTFSPLYYYFFWNLVVLLGFKPDLKTMPKDASLVISQALEEPINHFLQRYASEFAQERALKNLAREHFLAITKGIQ